MIEVGCKYQCADGTIVSINEVIPFNDGVNIYDGVYSDAGIYFNYDQDKRIVRKISA